MGGTSCTLRRRLRPELLQAVTVAVAVGLSTSCGGGGEPEPQSPYSVIDGKTVILLPVQYVRRDEGPWIGGARNEPDAARMATDEIVFALKEEPGRISWIFPEDQVAALKTRPMFDVDPYALSAEQARDKGTRMIRDPLYGEIRPLLAVMDARYVLWPVEVYYEHDKNSRTGRVVIRVLIADGRSGKVLYRASIKGDDHPTTSPVAMASAAQAFAITVNQ